MGQLHHIGGYFLPGPASGSIGAPGLKSIGIYENGDRWGETISGVNHLYPVLARLIVDERRRQLGAAALGMEFISRKKDNQEDYPQPVAIFTCIFKEGSDPMLHIRTVFRG
jgi:hypothetical protein